MVNRPDRRDDYLQLRAFSASQNILNKADGSSKFEFGSTAVMCSVSGPVEVQIRDEKLDEATLEVVVRPAKGVPNTKEKLMESILRTAFEPVILGGMMPRTLVQIVVQVMKDDGCVLAAAVNAVTVALLDAGIPMKYMAAAITGMINEDNELVLDPTAAELENAKSVHTFSFDNSHSNPHVLLSDSEGVFSDEQYFSCHDICFEAVEKVHGFLRIAVESKKNKEQQQMVGH
ncbi:ribosomal protein S5 domain 2-type protein [Pilaira anomala]|nr:ribosomal protein S5 domain 2-type protein [Pilaira anomala]